MFLNFRGGQFTCASDKRFWLVDDFDVAPILIEEAAGVGFLGADYWYENFAYNLANFNQYRQLLWTELGGVVADIGKLAFMEPKPDRPEFTKPSVSLGGRLVKVATKYPNIVAKYAKKQKEQIEIIRSRSPETMLKLGLCGAICDFVQTGETLEDNGFRAVSVSVLWPPSRIYLGGVYKNPEGSKPKPAQEIVYRYIERPKIQIH